MTMSTLAQASQNRYSFTLKMIGAYLLFSSLAVIGSVAKPAIGELADALWMTSVLWPYPLILALQHWVPNPGMACFLTVFVGGLLLVFLFGSYLERRYPSLSKRSWRAYALSCVLWYVPLLVVQIVVVCAVWTMGYPIGE